MFSYLDMPLALKYLEELKDIKIQTTGKDLQNFGINPSPEYQKCFDYILEEKLKNPALTKEQEIELVKNILKSKITLFRKFLEFYVNSHYEFLFL